MKKLNNIICKVIFMALPLLGGVGGGLLLSSCSSDDISYEPAEPVAADNWGVYFSSYNTSSIPRNESDSNVLEFKLKRLNTNGELTVPVNLEVSEGRFTAPESVTFEDGKEEATIQVTYEGLKPGVKLQATLSLPVAYTNPYKIKDGFFKQAIKVYIPVVICKNVTTPFIKATGVKHDIFDEVTSTIKQVPGENHFFWENFLGSGITLAFKLDLDNGGKFNEKDIKKCEGPILPLNHFIEDDGAYGWSLTADETATEDSEAATWIPEGADSGVNSYAYFYYCYEGSPYLYLYFWDKTQKYGWGYMSAVVIDGDESDDDQYDYYYIYLTYDKEELEALGVD